MKALNPETISAIKKALSEGKSSRDIGRALGVSKSVVNKVRQTMPEDTPRAKPGQKCRLTPRDRTHAVSLIKRGQVKTAVEVARVLNEGRVKPVCVETVRNALRQGHLVAKKKVKRPAVIKAEGGHTKY